MFLFADSPPAKYILYTAVQHSYGNNHVISLKATR